VRAVSGATRNTSHQSRLISDDGRHVYFSSREALVPEDVNGRADAYEYDTVTGRPSLLSTGTSPSPSYYLDAGANGRDAFFITRERLVGWDVDQGYDLYDARIGGGFPEPVAPPPGCVGDACQGAASGIPAAGLAGTGAFHGAGNVQEERVKPAGRRAKRRARRCRRGKVRKRVRGKVRCLTRKAARRATRRARAKQRLRAKQRSRAATIQRRAAR
jgi:hypothetical protein